MSGPGFSFSAPLGWRSTRAATSAAATHGAVDEVEVLRFTLERPYRRALFTATARELDAKVARFALELHGRLARSSTATIAGGPVRRYRIDYGAARVQELAFVLSGSEEFELFCLRRASDPAAPCEQLFSTFALSGRPG